MKISFFFIAFLLPMVFLYQELRLPLVPEKKYVCLPCGLTCDRMTHYSPGKCTSCGMDLVEEQTVHFKNIDFAELCNRMSVNKDLILLDVRTKEEFTNTHKEVESFGRFKNALNINVRELNDRIPELTKFKDKEVIVYCSHSHRSPQASYLLSNSGFTNVSNVVGGVSTLQGGSNPDCLKDQFIVFPPKE